MLLLLALVVLGLAFILSSMLDSDKSSLQKLFSEFYINLKVEYSYQRDPNFRPLELLLAIYLLMCFVHGRSATPG